MFVYFSTKNKKTISGLFLTFYNLLLWNLRIIQNIDLKGLTTHEKDFQTLGDSRAMKHHSRFMLTKSPKLKVMVIRKMKL